MAIGVGVGEGGVLVAAGDDAVDRGGVGHRYAEHLHDGGDAGEDDVGDRDLVAVAVGAGAGLGGEAAFDGLEAGGEPVDLPGAPLGVRKASFGREVAADAGGDERVGVGGEGGGEGADAGAAAGVGREKGWDGGDLIEVFEDGEGLGEGRVAGLDEGGDGCHGVDGEEGFGAVLAGVEADIVLGRGEAFEGEGDADAVAGGGAPVGVEGETGGVGHGEVLAGGDSCGGSSAAGGGDVLGRVGFRAGWAISQE